MYAFGPRNPLVSDNSTEIIVFRPDGTYAIVSPYTYSGRFKLAGDRVTLADGRQLRYSGSGLVGYQSVYVKEALGRR